MNNLTAHVMFEDADRSGRYSYRSAASGPAAEMTVSRAEPALLIIEHTGVPPAFRGRGIGLALVTPAIEDARRDGMKILPRCPFAAAQFGRHPEWAGVLYLKGVGSHSIPNVNRRGV